jgi:hypothetical protein
MGFFNSLGDKIAGGMGWGGKSQATRDITTDEQAAQKALSGQAGQLNNQLQNNLANPVSIRDISMPQGPSAMGAYNQAPDNISAVLAAQMNGTNDTSQNRAQGNAMDLSYQAALGLAPSVAQQQFANNTDQNLLAQKGLMSGGGYNPLAMQNLQSQGSQAGQNLAGQTAALRAQEMATARDQYGNLATQAVQLQQQAQAQASQRDLEMRAKMLIAQGMDADMAFKVAQANQQKDLMRMQNTTQMNQMLLQGSQAGWGKTSDISSNVANLNFQSDMAKAQADNQPWMKDMVSSGAQGIAALYGSGMFGKSGGTPGTGPKTPLSPGNGGGR